MRRIHLALFVALVASLCFAGTASATTALGSAFSPAISDLPGAITFQSTAATIPSSIVPAGGVITSFSHFSETTPDATLALVVLRPTATGFTVVGLSDPHNELGGQLNVFASRIPVLAGDVIGVEGDTANLAGASQSSNSQDIISGTGSAALGANIPTSSVTKYAGYTLDIAAKVEPDADQDGYGDDTQDLCPTNPATQGVCPDKTPPSIKLKLVKSQDATASLGLSLISNEAANAVVTGTLARTKKSAKPTKLAKSTSKLVAGKKRKLTIKLTGAARAALKHKKKLKASLVIKVTDPSGNITRSKATVMLHYKAATKK